MKTYTPLERSYIWLHNAARNRTQLFEQVYALIPDLNKAFALAKARRLPPLPSGGEEALKRLYDAASEAYIDETITWLEKNQAHIIIRESEEYPPLLKEIKHAPPLVYVKGKLNPGMRLPIAMVGMRKSTQYGEKVTRHLAGELARSGATIISGMALGIDSHAAWGALEAEGGTVAVLGSGIDVIYPGENAGLYYKIAESGAVISEFLPGTKPLRANFPQRNRVISGLSLGVVVVEAAERSGTTITANYALEQNRDVFAVPGRITDKSSVGPNGMIQRGEAKPVYCAADILCEYGACPAPVRPMADIDLSALSPFEGCIVQELKKGERNADELCEILSAPVQQVNSCLTSLQFSGIIKQLPGRVFGL
ncbi:MAG: DNA-processing protein DprA [Clostridiales bacterium]|jgi:DNA processing protein|nr:DNA-processing protein DprA [Clostridiales bacterium]